MSAVLFTAATAKTHHAKGKSVADAKANAARKERWSVGVLDENDTSTKIVIKPKKVVAV